VRKVVKRNPRVASVPADKIIIPGYESLRAFSQEHEKLLKAECGAPWQSYFLRSHWRMVFPVWPRHQARVAKQLSQALRQGSAPAVHLFRFPRITINHGLLVFGLTEAERDLHFDCYDPNIAEHPVKLSFDRASRAFSFPASCYWAGGLVRVIEIFRRGLY
jgi:hypothetical protein